MGRKRNGKVLYVMMSDSFEILFSRNIYYPGNRCYFTFVPFQKERINEAYKQGWLPVSVGEFSDFTNKEDFMHKRIDIEAGRVGDFEEFNKLRNKIILSGQLTRVFLIIEEEIEIIVDFKDEE